MILVENLIKYNFMHSTPIIHRPILQVAPIIQSSVDLFIW
ncbi:unnamed protein product [Schistosoma curassoni]|uniref:Uncharacterized protein n=1 Tax=Schistosoma curassoni TaxID=6186 RepID=A0A183JQT3_9TREM|nr:unnamed protein product [Schistosoma curassoni]